MENPAAATHLDDGAEPRQSLGQPEDAQHAQEPENDDGEHLHEDDEWRELHEAHADDEEVEAVPVAVVPAREVARRVAPLGQNLHHGLESEDCLGGAFAPRREPPSTVRSFVRSFVRSIIRSGMRTPNYYN